MWRQSKSGYFSEAPDTEGPPSTAILPAAWARAQMSWICPSWMCIPETNTASAQAKSAAEARLMFSSMKRHSQFSGM